MSESKKAGIHRAWIVFVGVCAYYFVAFGLLYSGFGLFLNPMSVDLGIPYVQLSSTATVRVLCGMVTTAFIGSISAKVKLRRFMAIVLIALAASILLVSVSNAMWQFYLVFAAMGFLCGLTLYGNVPIILNQWFEAPANLITIATATGGAGGIVLCPILNQVISSFGWRMGYRFMALLVLVVMLPIAAVLFDFRPADRGLAPVANKSRGKKTDTSESAMAKASGGKVSPLLFVLTAAFFLLAALAGGMYIHISSALATKGFQAVQISLLISCFQAGSTIFQFIPGLLSSRFGLRKVLTCVLPLGALGAAILVFTTPSVPFLGVALVVLLMGGGRLFSSLNPLMARYLFGQAGFQKAYPKLHSIFLIGTAFTSILYGAVYTATGSYNGTLWLMVGCLAANLILTHVILGIADREKSHQNVE